jgi:signal transduction histidine kinase
MFSKLNKVSLATKLTFWYSGIFCLTSFLAFALVYVLLGAMLQNNTEEEIQGDMAELLAVLRQIFLLTYPLLVICAALAGWTLGKKAMRGVELVTQTANAIAQGKIDDRVPHSNHGAEINRLTDTFNNMLDKIQLLIRGMHEINDNIAHDLRSPLTRIRGQAEAILTSSAVTDPAVYDQVLALTIEESDRLINMINTMLDITETEAGLMPAASSSVDISTLVHDACELFQPLAFDHQIDFTYHAQPSITLRGNASFLQRLVSNLIDNALKYTQPGGRVSVDLQKIQDTIQFKVEDTGLGINQEDIDKIFKRFFRCDNSRSLPGNGLGLSLALAIARAHLGDILVSSTKQAGSSFTVIFPAQSFNS